jgi:CRP/FNR family transcriptional regulator
MQEFKSNSPKTHFCMFSELSREQIASLKLQKIDNSYKKGEVLFSEGSYPKALYVVYKGIVKIHKYGVNGKEQITRLASAGDLIGYRSLLNDESYSASATAIEETSLFKIPSEAFFNLLKANSDFSMKVIQMLANDLRQSEKQVVDMAQKSVRERLAVSLLMLKDIYINEEKPTEVAEINLTREDLANIVGTATETIIRLLHDFKEEKLIQTNGRKIMVLDAQRLVKVGNIY